MTDPLWTAADLLRDCDEVHGIIAADAYTGGISEITAGRLAAYPNRTRTGLYLQFPSNLVERHGPEGARAQFDPAYRHTAMIDALARTNDMAPEAFGQVVPLLVPPGHGPAQPASNPPPPVTGVPAATPRLVRHIAQRRERLQQILNQLAEHAASRNMSKARRLLGWSTGLAESPLESLTALALHRLGIHDFWQQVAFPFDDALAGFSDRVDFYIPRLNLIIEADGWSKYNEYGPRMKQEKRREDRLALRHVVIRVEWSDVLPGPRGYRIIEKFRAKGFRI
ncbi:endonuclease domain-containing protein [Brevibacterium moorei]|uniref:endonuclease domain-containing protein n=1 Tax=Brevibacterium moorei TaxID=2968457 RepID=UPI00211CA294|nr:endonuclease domain-containing protein [Brevibacterium sp. 68QC2CO]MCQ9386217.1 endonuclease domain-containing protein [Brevibacterium sp. 68QC2CO]